MRVVVFGASGPTGLQLIHAFLERRWSPVAVLRPQSRWPALEGVHVVRGALTDPGTLDHALAGADAACCVFGPAPSSPEPFCAEVTTAILAALRRCGVSRYLCQTGAMIGVLPATISWPMRRLAAAVWRVHPAIATDRTTQEDLIMASDRAWTIVKPPRLTSGRPTGHYRAGVRLHVGLLSYISRADLASFHADELAAPQYLRQRVYVAH